MFRKLTHYNCMKYKGAQMKVINIKIFWVAACFGLALAGCEGTAKYTAEDMSLKDAYKGDFLIGAALSEDQIMGRQSNSLEVASREFSSVTAENSMKWEAIHPAANQFNFSVADKLVELAQANNQFIVGHTLLWHQQTPDWVFENEQGQAVSRAVLLKRLKHHIDTIVGRYKGKIQGWDVVNEALNEDGSMRDSKWYQIIGEDYIAKAFEFAQQADPDAELYYNDYNLWKPKKRQGVMRLVKSLQAQGIKISGVGMQAHYAIGYPDLTEMEASIVNFKSLGVDVMLTELDISVLPFPDEENQGADISQHFELQEKLNPYTQGLPADVQAQLSQTYVNIFAILLRHKEAISRVTLWGVDDAQTWRNYWPIQGRTDYPLLFDRDSQRKPVVHQLINLNK